MFVKFSRQSERIKGLSFHPQKPWLLTGLHTGKIQLWDYRLQTVIETFHEHEGPVRTVQFHQCLPLFASGGDDFTVRVWNYKTKKCVFVLRGHLDFVRSVFFHPELPWVISSSDDQTARIWNYQSRQMIAVLTGHSHYVMSCAFHPTKDLIITGSLDQTLRLWSFTQLRKKYATMRGDAGQNNSDIELTQILEGHNAGVNWCAFHPKENFIVSSSDDKKIKLWKFNETRCWEYDQLSGHTNNVSCAVYHPKMDIIISNSEDKTVRIWDLQKKVEVDCFTNKELDRFWVVAIHPESFTFACGSDSALYVFSLIKERVPYTVVGQQYLCMAERKTVKVIHLGTKQEQVIKQLEKLSLIKDNVLLDNVDQIQQNPYEINKTQLLIRLRLPRGSTDRAKHLLTNYEASKKQQTTQKDGDAFLAKSAVFVGPTRLACLDEHRQLWIYNYDLSSQTACHPKEKYIDRIFQAFGGKVLVVSDNRLELLDPPTQNVQFSYEFSAEQSKIKGCVWTSSHKYIAVYSKKLLTIMSKNLVRVCQVSEKLNIKSAIWLDEKVLIYSTVAQIKYLIINGETGVIRSTEQKFYLASIEQNEQKQWVISGVDSYYQVQKHIIELDDAFFKVALYEKNIIAIKAYLSKQQVPGEALVSYLFMKKQPLLAMKLVKDPQAKFSLALDSNHLETSYLLCKQLKNRQSYILLSAEAIRQGNFAIAEEAFKSLREFDKLSFIYALQGDTIKLSKMVQISQQRKSYNSQILNATLLGDTIERIQALNESKQIGLALLSASVHKLQTQADQIKNQITNIDLMKNLEESMKWLSQQQTKALIPAKPLIKSIKSSKIFGINWPHNYIAEDQQIILSGEKDQQPINDQQSNNNLLSSPLKKKVNQMQYIQINHNDEEEFLDIEEGLKEWGVNDGNQ